jgi:hypothetical protein
LPEPFGKAAIAGAQHRLAAIFDQRLFAFEHIDEFVFVRMPVALARPIARRQAHEIDPEISEPAGVAQPLPHAVGTGCVEWRRIARPLRSGTAVMSILGMAVFPAISDRAYARPATIRRKVIPL